MADCVNSDMGREGGWEGGWERSGGARLGEARICCWGSTTHGRTHGGGGRVRAAADKRAVVGWEEGEWVAGARAWER